MRAQTLGKMKELVDELEAEWQSRLQMHQATSVDAYTPLPKEAERARDNTGAASDLYLRFLKQFTAESREYMERIGYIKKPPTFLAQKVEASDD